MTAKQIDRAYAKLTKRAITQTKIWKIERVRGDRNCAKRLHSITNEQAGYVFEVACVPTTETWTICWWTWHDDEG